MCPYLLSLKVGSLRYVPDGSKQGFSAVVGGLNIFCGILGALMSFLKYAEVYEAQESLP